MTIYKSKNPKVNKEVQEEKLKVDSYAWEHGELFTKTNTDENFLKNICRIISDYFKNEFNRKFNVYPAIRNDSCDIIVTYDSNENFSKDKFFNYLELYKVNIIFTNIFFEKGYQSDFILSSKTKVVSYMDSKTFEKEGNGNLVLRIKKEKSTNIVEVKIDECNF